VSDPVKANINCAVLVIDMQQALVPGAYNEANVIAAINNVVQRARGAGHPVIYIQHCHQQYKPMMKGEDGWKIYAEMDYVSQTRSLRKLQAMRSINPVSPNDFDRWTSSNW